MALPLPATNSSRYYEAFAPWQDLAACLLPFFPQDHLDGSHGLSQIYRVWTNVRRIQAQEGATWKSSHYTIALSWKKPATAPMGLVAAAYQGDKSPRPPAAPRTTENAQVRPSPAMS